MTSRRLRLGSLAVLAAGMSLAGTSAISTAKSGVPFKADFSGSAAFSGPASTAFVGSGNASHMGRISTSGHADHFVGDPSCPGGIGNTNTEVLTAANGDTLTIVSNDVACPVGDPTLQQYHGTGHWSVEPGTGTGRFSNASGEGTFDGHSDFLSQTFAATLTGSIDY